MQDKLKALSDQIRVYEREKDAQVDRAKGLELENQQLRSQITKLTSEAHALTERAKQTEKQVADLEGLHQAAVKSSTEKLNKMKSDIEKER